MQDIDWLIDDVRAHAPGSVARALGEAQLLVQAWTRLPTMKHRADLIEYISDAARLLGEVSLAYVE